VLLFGSITFLRLKRKLEICDVFLKRVIDIRWRGLSLPPSPSDRNHTVEQKLGDRSR
jgi:hypothetical protein